MSIGLKFLSAIAADKSVSAFLEYGPLDHLFKASEEEPYLFVKDFVKKHQSIPSLETIKAHTGSTLVKHQEPASYYHELMETRHVELEMKKGMKKASDLLGLEGHDPQQALVELAGMVMSLVGKKNAKQVVDFRHAYASLIADYVAQNTQGDEYGLRLGWPTLDSMSGGLVKGDKVGIVGRPAAGKTWQMLFSALHGWQAAQALFAKEKDIDILEQAAATQSRMFVSMEMGVLPIQQRLAAIQTHLPASQIKHGKLTTNSFKQYKKGLMEISGFGAPFWVVDGNLAATVEDIWMLARQLGPAGIFIDGGYLVKHPTEKDRFRRVAENAELIKSELCALAPSVVSWQFAKSASKKSAKKGEKVTYDDVGYSDAIAQVSSLLLGTFEEESVATLKQRKIEILKGRSGEVGSFLTNWNFHAMDFTERFEEQVDELSFL